MTARRTLAAIAALITLGRGSTATAAPLFRPWMDGTRPEPITQVQRYDADTYVIRQSIRTNFEGPFLYLLFGRDRALLLDTGAGGLEVRPTVEAVVARWRAAHHGRAVHLVVAHSHGHGDHHMGDAEFQGRPDTEVVGLAPEAVAVAFHIARWPEDIGRYDLGGRVLDIIPTPGHQAAHIMVFDEKTCLLLSGDTLYPGRLYVPVNQAAVWRASLDRAVAFTRGRHVRHVLGAHIEMSTAPGDDYPMKAANHPDEHVLQLPYADLLELRTLAHAMGDALVRQVRPDFIVYPVPPR